MREYGKKVWFIPDGDRPPQGEGQLKGHESIVIQNPNKSDANCKITFYFEDREPIRDIEVFVGAERVRCVKTDMDDVFFDSKPPLTTQYAIKVESDTPIIVLYGRLDNRQTNLAYYMTMGYFE